MLEIRNKVELDVLYKYNCKKAVFRFPLTSEVLALLKIFRAPGITFLLALMGLSLFRFKCFHHCGVFRVYFVKVWILLLVFSKITSMIKLFVLEYRNILRKTTIFHSQFDRCLSRFSLTNHLIENKNITSSVNSLTQSCHVLHSPFRRVPRSIGKTAKKVENW